MDKFTPDILILGYSGNNTEVREVFAYRAITFFGRPFQGRSANLRICNFIQIFNIVFDGRFRCKKFKCIVPITPSHNIAIVKRFRLFRFRSPLLTESILFIFLWVLRCFTSPGTLPAFAE